MKLKILVLSILVVMFFFGCKKDAQKTIPNAFESEEISLLDTLKLKLDNGKKWVVNNETQIGIAKMDSILKSAKFDGIESYVDLGNQLSKQTSYIIKSCDMTGEAHDQLHVVLVPILDEISILKEATHVNESKNALSRIKKLIEDYYNHFKI